MARDADACRRDRRTGPWLSTDDPVAPDPRSRTRRTVRPAPLASVPSSPDLPCLKGSESAATVSLKRSFSTQSAQIDQYFHMGQRPLWVDVAETGPST